MSNYPEGVTEADIDALSVEEEPVHCNWCNTPVPDDSEAPDGFCSDNCFETNRAEDDDYGRDYDAGPNTSDRGILRDEFHQ